MDDDDNVLRWTAERLLADDQPAYGSIHQGIRPCWQVHLIVLEGTVPYVCRQFLFPLM